MKRIKPEDSLDFTSVPPPKRVVPSPHYFQHPTRMSTSYHSYGQNFMYSGGPRVQTPPPPPSETWRHIPPPPTPPLPYRHPLGFYPTQPPPSFHRNSPSPSISGQKNITIPSLHSPTSGNPLMLHHPIRLRGRGRSQFRTGIIGSFDRGGRLRNPTPNSISVKSPQLLYNNSQKLGNGQNCHMVEVDCCDDNQTHINKKSKRKPMSTRYTRAKEWDRDDAMKALVLEKEYNKLQSTPMLILKFPDPDLNKYTVKKYSHFIETVHFQQPSTPRYCFVQLKAGSDIEQVRKDLCEIPFGTGKIRAERKFQNPEEEQAVTPEEIDPYTLYIGNLPTQISVKTIKETFPKATRIDIGYAQRMKYTRYAFIRYSNVEDSMEAYKNTFNTLISNRSLIVRFRRAKGNIGLPGESKIPNPRKTPTTTTTSTTTTSEIITTSQITSPDHNEIPEIITTVNDTENTSRILNDLSTETDTKENVLGDAETLAAQLSSISNNTTEPSSINNQNPTIKTEEDDSLYPNGIGVLPANTLLGTRIKDEPLDDDELLAQAQCYEDDEMDDESDCEPEEEDDFEDNVTQHQTGRLLKPTTEEYEQPGNWEDIRQTELIREETKPDFNTLVSLPDNVFDNIAHTKLPDPFAKKPTDKENLSLSNNVQYKDDLDELFSSMNPEDENDEFDF